MGVILTKPQTSSGGASGGSGAYTSAEKLAIELEMSFKAANLYNYKELGYTSGLLTNVNIYVDDTKTTQLFRKELDYDISDKLYTVTLTRISPSASLIKTLGYDGNDNLITVTISGSEY